MLDYLNWELSVLCKAVVFPNLSAASSQIGMSQPQLSRIVKSIEEKVGMVLLDSSIRRRAVWTPAAQKLALIYNKTFQGMNRELESLTNSLEQTVFQVGTLEGLSSVASEFSHYLFDACGAKVVEMDVYDLNDLEEHFFKGVFHFIFTSREPGRKKYKNQKKIGFQTMDWKQPDQELSQGVSVMSAFEYHSSSTQKPRRGELAAPVFVSNSLEVRKNWIHDFNGQGWIPSRLKMGTPSAKALPALLIAADSVGQTQWEKLKSWKPKL